MRTKRRHSLRAYPDRTLALLALPVLTALSVGAGGCASVELIHSELGRNIPWRVTSTPPGVAVHVEIRNEGLPGRGAFDITTPYTEGPGTGGLIKYVVFQGFQHRQLWHLTAYKPGYRTIERELGSDEIPTLLHLDLIADGGSNRAEAQPTLPPMPFALEPHATAAAAPSKSVASSRNQGDDPCPEGQLSVDAGGHCCWPGQKWSQDADHCLGSPQCPEGLVTSGVTSLPEGPIGSCVRVALPMCPEGMRVTASTNGHCCWPGQSWSDATGRCEGPPICEPGWAAQGPGCVRSERLPPRESLPTEQQQRALEQARADQWRNPPRREQQTPHPIPRNARSFFSLGGVGYLIPTSLLPGATSSGGVSTILGGYGGMGIEALRLFPLFRTHVVDGGITLMGGFDLAFVSGNGLAVLNTAWVGTGFDLGVTRFLQFGPRIGLGYAFVHASSPALPTDINAIGAMLLVGAHIQFWMTRAVGLYFEPDGALLFPGWLPRIAGGLSFGF